MRTVTISSSTDDYSQKLIDDLEYEWLPLVMNNHGSNPFKDAGLFYQFWGYYRALQPVAALRFTIENNVYGTWVARALRVPVINNVSGLCTAFIRKGLASTIVRLRYRTSQLFAHRIFCQNKEYLARLVEAKLVPRDRLGLLPGSGFDLDRFNPSLGTAHLSSFRFLYAGRMLSDKGLSELIEACRSINSDGIRCSLSLSGFADAESVSAIASQQLAAWGGGGYRLVRTQ